MPDLDFGVALGLAGSLTTIGHPWAEAAIRATAMDLVRWCHGGFVDGRPVSPEEQAQRLAETVRETWEEWPEKGGTKRLHELFDQMFPPKSQSEPAPDLADFAKRGLLPKPCIHCGPRETFCEHGGAKGHAAFLEDQRYWAERSKQRPNPTPPRGSVLSISELRSAIANEEAEIRQRKVSDSDGNAEDRAS